MQNASTQLAKYEWHACICIILASDHSQQLQRPNRLQDTQRYYICRTLSHSFSDVELHTENRYSYTISQQSQPDICTTLTYPISEPDEWASAPEEHHTDQHIAIRGIGHINVRAHCHKSHGDRAFRILPCAICSCLIVSLDLRVQ